VAKDFAVKGIKVTPSNAEFTTKVEKTGKDEFKIDVQPKDTSKMLAASLTIQPEDSPKMYYANVRVMPPPSTPAANSLALPLTPQVANPSATPSPKPPTH